VSNSVLKKALFARKQASFEMPVYNDTKSTYHQQTPFRTSIDIELDLHTAKHSLERRKVLFVIFYRFS